MDIEIKYDIKHIQDYRNYKVSIEKANKTLSFHPKNDVETIVEDLIKYKEEFKNFENPDYYNIQVFKKLSSNMQ
jgi:UDP-glucose 4-epimerase